MNPHDNHNTLLQDLINAGPSLEIQARSGVQYSSYIASAQFLLDAEEQIKASYYTIH